MWDCGAAGGGNLSEGEGLVVGGKVGLRWDGIHLGGSRCDRLERLLGLLLLLGRRLLLLTQFLLLLLLLLL